MSYLDWHVGMKVVCVDGGGQWAFHKPVVQGRIYTIRGIWAHPDTGQIGITVDEIVNDIHPTYQMERGYEVGRFRKVQPRKTDISLFTAMLSHSKQRVDA